MEQCERCGKGFCASRVRRIYGKMNKDYCSPQCFTNDSIDKFNARHNMELAEKIFDELAVNDVISDHLATDPDQAADAILMIAEILKGEKSA